MGLEDLAYLSIRLLLACLSSLGAIVTFIYAWQLAAGGSRRWIAAAGGILLTVGAVLSVYDAIVNAFVLRDQPILVVSWVWLFAFDLLLPLWAFLLVGAWRQRDRAEAALARLAVTDLLTGLLNRRGFFEHATSAIAQARRSRVPVAVAMFDIDRFKLINDGYGHDAGDAVLRQVAEALSADQRAGDVLGRFGGEEFVLLTPGNDASQAALTVERLRAAVRSAVLHPAGETASVTMSAGIAGLSDQGDVESAINTALVAADTGLYEAKRTGRDRAVIAAGGPEPLAISNA